MISYFTDGSASPNPGPGGFAVIKNGIPYLIGGEPENSEISRNNTTNIRMEGFALLAAFDDFLQNHSENENHSEKINCEITTDSEFWVNVLTKWAQTWQKNNWQKKGGIKNLDIVKPLFESWLTAQKNDAKLIWTRAHVGTEMNELADNWANEARKRKVVGVQKINSAD